MGHIEDIVNSLENKIGMLLHEYERLKQLNSMLEQELKQCKDQLQDRDKTILEWQDKNEALQIANTILGSDDNKRETKLKINTLIREIDQCIAQLSE
ncbi:hypothetical protein [Mangrovimonas aestuarii]|uniref:hypothetical protein n=1 Tax=Mangrovimonas aestuarii TaxID=3018443 RepID=UPI002379F3EC|nr:hypothetical protein [Mangrovimonas aestuarii]